MKPATLYPYEVSELLVLRLYDFDDPTTGSSIAVKEFGTARESDEVESVGPTGYDATHDGTWRKLTFRLEVRLPVAELERVLPATSDVENDTSLVVLMTCASTRYRRGVRLRPVNRGCWVSHATVVRGDVQGTLTLHPQLVRLSSIPDDDRLPYATRAGTMVALGDAVSLYVDAQPPVPGLTSSVKAAWEDFANSDDPWRREHPDDVYHLEPFGVEPRLWLNSRYGQLRDALDSTAKRGREAALRDMFGVLIAQPVWIQLTMTSLAALELDSDSGTVSAPSGWRGDLLSMMLPSLYPEEPDADERLRRAVGEFREADGSGSLAARLGTAVQSLLASFKTVEGALRAFENVRDDEDAADD